MLVAVPGTDPTGGDLMPSLPPITLDSVVDPADRISAIDFINRVNLLFDAWNIDAMVEAFLPDSVTYHTGGVNHGQEETRRFFQQVSPYVDRGVSRIATNPIVDADGDGVIVRYHNMLIRYTADAPAGAITGQLPGSTNALPAIWVYSAMTDRLRRTERGWRIWERHVGVTAMNDQVHPVAPSQPYFDNPYRPRVMANPVRLRGL